MDVKLMYIPDDDNKNYIERNDWLNIWHIVIQYSKFLSQRMRKSVYKFDLQYNYFKRKKPTKVNGDCMFVRICKNYGY